MATSAFVTLAVFEYPHECAVLRSRLEAEGIPTFVQDAFTLSIHPFMSQALGGVKLKVRREDLEDAVSVLKSLKEDAPEMHFKDEWDLEETAALASEMLHKNRRQQRQLLIARWVFGGIALLSLLVLLYLSQLV